MTTRSDTPRRGLRYRVDGAVPFGLALIVLGVLLALDNLEVVDASELLAGWWPAAVILVGVWWAVTGAPVSGLFVAVVGAMLLLSTLELVDIPLGSLIFPGILVVVGGAMLQAGMRVRAAHIEVAELPGAAGDQGSEGLAATAVFGDARLIVGDDGVDTDRLVVSATSVFGDVRIDVPAGWRLENRITKLLGDVTLPREQPSHAESPVVVLHGLVLFGDVRVRYSEPVEGGR
ncbi:MAG: hypothetical protein EA340_10945 [Nitriliruptor sp.]|nr:MAG: hypothetical protein EA340_10945 [Nitriliruptor sp.]